MQFANPIFLWALTGLSIPIGIHLLSRKEGKVIRLGSLRHVHETSTQQFRGIRLNEILLLVLRCLLIVLFTFIVSGLHWNNLNKKKWALLENGLEREPLILPIVDSLKEEGYEARLLTEDFPLLEDGDSVSSRVNYHWLIEKLISKNLSDVIVFAQNRVTNFTGMRSDLPTNMRWISQPLRPLDFTLQALPIKGDSMLVREGHTSSEAMHFTTKTVSRSAGVIETESLDTISLTLVSDEKYAYDRKIIVSALMAINNSFPAKLKVKEIRSTDSLSPSDWVIWLSDKNIPEVVSNSLYIKAQFANQQKLFLQLENNQWIITQRLNEEVALQENVTLKLASLLIPSRELWIKADSIDRRMIPDSAAWAMQTDSENMKAGVVSKTANPYLIVFLVIVLFVERILAYKRNQ